MDQRSDQTAIDYYTRDHEGSVRELCSSTGAIVARYSYDPYGRTVSVQRSGVLTKPESGDW